MKKLVSLCLAALLLLSMAPMRVSAMEMENQTLQKMEEAIKRNSKAEIRDADGNLLETLDVDVQVEQISTSRSADGVEYRITYTTRSKRDEWPDSDAVDGIEGIIVMTCRDELGTDNTLISVTGNWSGSDSDTENRTVTYRAYDVFNIAKPEVADYNAPRMFEYRPSDYKGFTFKATSYAKIKSTGGEIYLEAATDPSVLNKQ